MSREVYRYLSPSGGEAWNLPGSVMMEHHKFTDRYGRRQFPYRHVDPSHPSGWRWGKPPWGDGLLYGLEHLQAVTDVLASAHWTVYWCEGEKDADTVNALRLPRIAAVSHHGGAGKATPEQADYLSGWLGRIVIAADIDPAGAVCAWGRYRLLRRIGIAAGQLTVVRAAGRRSKGRDVTDHLNDGYALSDLVAVDLKKLARYISRLTPSQRIDGSGWKTGDPEVDNFRMRDWSPTVASASGGVR